LFDVLIEIQDALILLSR